MSKPDTCPKDSSQRFAEEANQSRPGLPREFADFLRHDKKWWLAPNILTPLLLSVIVIVGGTAAAPFIYPPL